MKKPLFKFTFYISIGLNGFHLGLFAENETEALKKAKKTVNGIDYRIQSVEEVEKWKTKKK